ncbi:MAG TPA: hypothetical protein VGV38_22325 [Pyrinomonadaceae bacterium]|nr:hypothetical protein [Pyrinomonadaceae bacterium]
MPPPTAARVLSPLPSRPLSPRLEALRAEVMRQTGETRGLEWKDEVGMTELTGWEYGTRAKEVADALGGDDLKALGRLAVAGGILPAGTDLATLAGSFTAAASGAIYSPFDRRVLLLQSEPSARPTASADRSLLTHEFVHALQDQHFDLLKMLLVRPYNFDRTEALFALVEGDATNVQRRRESGEAWSKRSLDDIARQEEERFGSSRRELGAFFPPLLTETFVFRYRDGARFVEAVRRAGGSADEAFRRPPASSEQVLHPEKYLAGEAPREAKVDEGRFTRRGYRLAASTPLGEIGVRGLLLAGASRAAAGWGGDRAYVFEREGSAALFVWQTVWDRREDAQEFFRAYGALQRSRGAASADAALAHVGDAQTLWRKDNLLTLVRLEGDSVLILRGTEADIASALAD